MFKNLATVHISSIKTFVHLHKTQAELRELYPHDHSTCLSIKKKEGSQDILQAQVHQKLEWKVDKCCNDPDKMAFDEEKHTLANLVAKGHNVAALFMEVGQEQKKSLLDGLAAELDPINTKIEYAFFGFTDTYCYDLRRNVVCASSSLIKKGLDHWMKQVNSIEEIWKLVLKGSKIPSVLKINTFNSSTNRFGSFFLFDLLEPKFIELLPSASTAADANVNGISNCFDNLRSLIKYIADTQTGENSPGVPVITDYYFLTHTVARFICSQGQFAVFAHMNECLKYHKRETLMTLDLLEKLQRIRVVSLANEFAVSKDSDRHNYKLDEYKDKLQDAYSDIEEKKSFIQRLKNTSEQLSSLLGKKETQQKEFAAQQERKWEKDMAKIQSKVNRKRALLLNRHRSTFNKIKDLTLSKMSFLKKKMDMLQKERDRWKHLFVQGEKENKQLRLKCKHSAKLREKNENMLSRELAILRTEREEFIEMFHELQKTLTEKNIDLDK
ncbi:hypothetical protein BD408DRAFT_435390 [Parasitella parasitica]|nr:hypothetical protein BD408DRAFT_435390 [Parasitella parasitica]